MLTSGSYVGLADEEEDCDFVERFAALKAEFETQLVEEAALNRAIAENLSKGLLKNNFMMVHDTGANSTLQFN